MQQVYHSNVTTNLNIRTQLQNSSATNLELAVRIDVSEQTAPNRQPPAPHHLDSPVVVIVLSR